MAIFGELRTVWIFVMFDLPTEDFEDKKEYALFRKHLLKDGFVMLQYSIYVRHCPSEENMKVHKDRIKMCLPAGGEIRILHISDAQFGNMDLFLGTRKIKEIINTPQQVELF